MEKKYADYAVEKALELAGKDGVVLAFGSLFMTGPIRQLVKTDLP